jgi:hypothetical protein
VANTDTINTQKFGLEGRFAFTKDLFQTRTDPETGKNRGYGCTILFPKTADLAPLKDLAVQAAVAQWGDKAKAWLADGTIKSPFLDGDGKQGRSNKTGERHPGYEGHVFIRASSGPDYKPGVFVPDGNGFSPATPETFYSGCYGFAGLNAFTWDNPKNGKGVTFGVSIVAKSRDGEKLGGGGAPSDPNAFFEAIPDEGEAPKETAGGSGAAGFFG